MRRAGVAVLFGVLVVALGLVTTLSTPITGIIGVVLAVVVYGASPWFYNTVLGRGKKDPRLLRHYELLKNEVYSKLRESDVVPVYDTMTGWRQEDEHHEGIAAPLYLEISGLAAIDIGVRDWAFDHLKHRSYRWYMERYQETRQMIKEHNQRVSSLINELREDVTQLMLKFYMLFETEKVKAMEDESRERIVGIIISEKGPVQEGGILSQSVIENPKLETFRGLFMGEVLVLVKKYVPRLEELKADSNNAYTAYFQFPTFMARLINSIDVMHELKGECGFEKEGMKGGYA
ncbi:MAG: hypothetical protein JRN62_10500 [Nitrososphaerota archaeon]|nr:hypothetical protein [Nitrososphaerota archaeon]